MHDFWAAFQDGFAQTGVVFRIPLSELCHGQQNGEDIVDVVFGVAELVAEDLQRFCGIWGGSLVHGGILTGELGVTVVCLQTRGNTPHP